MDRHLQSVYGSTDYVRKKLVADNHNKSAGIISETDISRTTRSVYENMELMFGLNQSQILEYVHLGRHNSTDTFICIYDFFPI